MPAQLPADLSSFVGREPELRTLSALADLAPDRPVVAVIHGMGGTGKTSLAIQAGHRVAGHFPDGQIFLDLCGFTPGVEPVEPAAALERLLGALGVPSDQIPCHTDDRAALWRTCLASKRVLLVLDNVRSADQLRPLLPGTPGCLVLATSRRGLTVLDDAYSVALDTLPPDDAIALLREVVGEQRLSDEPAEALAELARLCSGLPLALRLAAARWRLRPGRPLADLVAGLADQRYRLAELEVPGRSVESVLWLSYEDLPPDAARLFRRLALHPGLNFDAYAAAALLGVEPATAARLVDELVDAHLVRVREDNRFVLHDLVRALAYTALTRDEPEAEQEAAMDRLIGHYRYLTSMAMDLISPGARSRRPETPPRPASALDLCTRADATAALDAELANLVAMAGRCVELRRSSTTYHLAMSLGGYLLYRWLGHEALALQGHAVEAARRDGDQVMLGRIMTRFGLAQIMVERYAAAEKHLLAAVQQLEASGSDGACADLARGYDYLGRAALGLGKFQDTIAHNRSALAAYRRCGDDNGVFRALQGLAEVHNLLQDAEAAHTYEAEAWTLVTAGLDDEHLADWFSTSAETQLLLGDRRTAIEYAERAIITYRALNAPLFESETLAFLGRAYAGIDEERSRRRHQEALEIADKLGHAGMRSEAALTFAESLLEYGDPSDAFTYARNALKFASESGWPHDVARSHRCIGMCYHRLGDTVRALDHWAEALRIFDSLGTPDANELRRLLTAHKNSA